MGVVALILVLGVQAAAASGLAATWTGAVLLAVAIAASRSSLLIACRTGVPAARPDGLGALVAGSVGSSSAAAGGLLVTAVVVTAAVASGRPWWLALLAAAAAVLVASVTVRHCVRRLGGVTGDVLGATVELTLTTLLLGLSVG
jgi:adenosylcobinamide-GDP ribazoletransferase